METAWLTSTKSSQQVAQFLAYDCEALYSLSYAEHQKMVCILLPLKTNQRLMELSNVVFFLFFSGISIVIDGLL